MSQTPYTPITPVETTTSTTPVRRTPVSTPDSRPTAPQRTATISTVASGPEEPAPCVTTEFQAVLWTRPQGWSTGTVIVCVSQAGRVSAGLFTPERGSRRRADAIESSLPGLVDGAYGDLREQPSATLARWALAQGLRAELSRIETQVSPGPGLVLSHKGVGGWLTCAGEPLRAVRVGRNTFGPHLEVHRAVARVAGAMLAELSGDLGQRRSAAAAATTFR